MNTQTRPHNQPAQEADQKQPFTATDGGVPEPPRGWNRARELGPGFL
jgi:hypothetical protein